MSKPKVAFICVHNSCRSQMAEAIAKILAGDVFEAYSAGTQIKPQINTDAVAVIASRYGRDITGSQWPKRLSEIPAPDVVITMGCGVACPILPCRYREDWGLEDPSGKGREAFEKTAEAIEAKVLALKQNISELLKGSV